MGRTGGCGKKESKHPRAGDLSGWCSDCECNTRQPHLAMEQFTQQKWKLCIVVRMKEQVGLWKARGGVWPCAMTGLGLGKAPRVFGRGNCWCRSFLLQIVLELLGCELADCQGVPAGHRWPASRSRCSSRRPILPIPRSVALLPTRLQPPKLKGS